MADYQTIRTAGVGARTAQASGAAGHDRLPAGYSNIVGWQGGRSFTA